MKLPFGNIDHVAIVVRSMKQSIRFYEKNFGFKIERTFGNKDLGINAVVMKQKNSRIELFYYKSGKPQYARHQQMIHGRKVPASYFEPGIRHIAFRTKKFNESVKFLNKQGLKPWVKPKRGYSGDSITFFEDPNGIILEIVSPVGKR